MDHILVLLLALVVAPVAVYVFFTLRTSARSGPNASADDIIRRTSEQRRKIAQVNRERTPSAPR